MAKTHGTHIDPTPKLRLMSFNIHGGRSLDGRRDLRRVHELMQRLQVDIGIFQEMETRTSRGAAAGDLERLAGAERPYHATGATLEDATGWYGNAIVSRYPITQCHVHNLETNPRLEPRSALDVRVETPWGAVRLIGTHLSLVVRERSSEARHLMRLVQDAEEETLCPLILLGDFNEWQWRSALLRYINRAMQPVPCGATFPSYCPVLHLDRVWYDASDWWLTAKRVRHRGVWRLSDHLPVLVEAQKLPA